MSAISCQSTAPGAWLAAQNRAYGFRILARLARCLIDGEAIVCDETVDPPSWRDRQRHAAQVAGDGFAASGGALDILRSSAAQGTIAKAVTGYQGLITEAG